MRQLFCTFVLAILVTSTVTHGAEKKAPAKSTTGAKKTASKEVSPCQARVEKLIHAAAMAMGLQKPFGLTMSREVGEPDIANRPTTNFNSGVFIVDDGYVTNSGASVTVRDADKSCEIIKMTVNIGG